MATLFLAHSAGDHDRALALAAGLHAAGHTARTNPEPAGDAGWWAGILSAIDEADIFLYATTPGESTAVVVAEREHAEALGLPTLEVHLSGPGAATGIDFREPDAGAAFHLIGAIAALPPQVPVAEPPAAPEPPFAGVADLLREVRAPQLAPADQHALVDRLVADRFDPAVRELAAVLRLRPDLDGETARRLDQEITLAPAEPRVEVAKVIGPRWSPPGSLTPEDVHRVGFRRAPLGRPGYDEESVDRFLDQVEADLRARHAGGPVVRVGLTASDVHATAFLRPPFGRRGYDVAQVDLFLGEIQRTFTALDQDLAAHGADVAKS